MIRPKIILFHPMTLHEKNYRYHYIPYSILSVASVIDREKYELQLIDNNVEKRSDYYDLVAASSHNLLCVGISSMMGHQIRDGFSFAQAVRRVNPSIPIIWGGPLPTILPQDTIAHKYVDFIVRGQGEETFVELLETLAHDLPIANIKGISYKVDGQIIHNPPREFVDINKFPSYSSVFDLINPTDYIRFDEHINTRTVNYHSSQGCPFNCGFCCETTLWSRRWSAFTAKRTLDDIEVLASVFNINGIKFYDSEFFINQERVFEFSEGVIERGLEIRWAASVHPKNLARLTERQFDLLRRSGVARLLLGAESGLQEELDLVGKGTNREMILRLATLCSQFDIVACFTFVTGYPSSPPSSIEATLDFAKQLREIDQRHECKVHFYAPYPGTPLYPYALKHGFVPPKTLEEWSWYDYYDAVAPWVDRKYELIAREFNEMAYPYLHPFADLSKERTVSRTA